MLVCNLVIIKNACFNTIEIDTQKQFNKLIFFHLIWLHMEVQGAARRICKKILKMKDNKSKSFEYWVSKSAPGGSKTIY